MSSVTITIPLSLLDTLNRSAHPSQRATVDWRPATHAYRNDTLDAPPNACVAIQFEAEVPDTYRDVDHDDPLADEAIPCPGIWKMTKPRLVID